MNRTNILALRGLIIFSNGETDSESTNAENHLRDITCYKGEEKNQQPRRARSLCELSFELLPDGQEGVSKWKVKGLWEVDSCANVLRWGGTSLSFSRTSDEISSLQEQSGGEVWKSESELGAGKVTQDLVNQREV